MNKKKISKINKLSDLLVNGFIRFKTKYNIQTIPIELIKVIAIFFQRTYQIDSKILQDGSENKKMFYNLIENKLEKEVECSLLFRASLHNYSNGMFHRYCDQKGATVTIVKSTDGSVFGGYTSVSWDSANGTWLKDDTAFLFAIKGNQHKIYNQNDKEKHVFETIEGTDGDIKVPIVLSGDAVRHFIYCGPIFRAGHDIWIGGQRCNISNTINYCSDYIYNFEDTKVANHPVNFIVQEYEVFLLTPKGMLANNNLN